MWTKVDEKYHRFLLRSTLVLVNYRIYSSMRGQNHQSSSKLVLDAIGKLRGSEKTFSLRHPHCLSNLWTQCRKYEKYQNTGRRPIKKDNENRALWIFFCGFGLRTSRSHTSDQWGSHPSFSSMRQWSTSIEWYVSFLSMWRSLSERA